MVVYLWYMNHLGFKFLIISILLFLGVQVNGQKYLQLEKRNSLKTEKFPIGTILSIKTKQFPKSWYTGRLDDVIVEDGIIVFDTKAVRIEDVIVLRKNSGSGVYKATRILSKTLEGLGINIVFWGTFDALLSEREGLSSNSDRKELLGAYWIIGSGS